MKVVSFDQLWFTRAGNHLEISVVGTQDKVTVNNWFVGTSYRVEQFQTSGGTLSDSNAQTLVDAMKATPRPLRMVTGLGDAYPGLVEVIGGLWERA